MTEAGRNLLTQAGHAGHLLVDELQLPLQTVPDRIRAAIVLLGGHVSPHGPRRQLLGVKHLSDLRERKPEQLLQLLDAFEPFDVGGRVEAEASLHPFRRVQQTTFFVEPERPLRQMREDGRLTDL